MVCSHGRRIYLITDKIHLKHTHTHTLTDTSRLITYLFSVLCDLRSNQGLDLLFMDRSYQLLDPYTQTVVISWQKERSRPASQRFSLTQEEPKMHNIQFSG